jgi:hypothetical protein
VGADQVFAAQSSIPFGRARFAGSSRVLDVSNQFPP